MKLTGCELIANERARQMTDEEWTPEHDDTHKNAEMSRAAIVYAGCAVMQTAEGGFTLPNRAREWPWSADWWKPSDDPIRNLVKAGALIAAEIDRLQRKATDAFQFRAEESASDCCGVPIIGPREDPVCRDCKEHCGIQQDDA